MWPFHSTPQTERVPSADLDEIRSALRKLDERISDLETEEFKLAELRRQARNAVRSLERAAANAQDPHQGTNGKRAGVDLPPPTIAAPGPRRNY